MKIKVTQDHIDKGKKTDACKCPIALACQEALGLPDLAVGRYSFFNNNKVKAPANLSPWEHHFTAPKVVRDFIEKFDETWWPLKPFEFEIDETEIRKLF